MLVNQLALMVAGLASLTLAGRPCGFKIAPCPEKSVCRPVSPKCTNLNVCAGICVPRRKYPACGGHRPQPVECPKGSACKDDPRVPGCGLACDAPGICIPDAAPTCGGIGARQCPMGLKCFDAPNDGCDPLRGGRDCGGVCL